MATSRREMVLVGQCSLPGAAQQPARNDGQDGTVAGEAPHLSIYKDGFWSVGCRLDAMQLEGDKYGDEAQSYDVGRSVNTSIVRYDEILDRENQKSMSPQVCFDFCRTVPDMSFFGLVHGRDCYCMHYYKDTAGGSGVCDLACEGDTAAICGGEHKSSIYQMHSCEGGLQQDMADTQAEAETVLDAVGQAAGVTMEVAEAMQTSGDALEALAEATASPLAQEAKTVAGPLTRAAEDLSTLQQEMLELGESYPEGSDLDTADFETRKKVEAGLAKAEDFMDAADEAIPAANEWVNRTQPDIRLNEDFTNTFVPILRQVEPEIERRMSVCTGDLTGTPIVGLSYDQCTQACDDLAPKSAPEHCISVQYFDLPGTEPLCFLYKELTELTVFNCDYEGDGASAPEKTEEAGDEDKKGRFAAGAEARESFGKQGENMKFLQKKHHKKHHKGHKVVRRHPKAKAHKARHPERAFFAHPAAKYVLQEAFHFRHVAHKASEPSAFCSIRYASTVGVTPTFFDGMTKLDRCFGAE